MTIHFVDTKITSFQRQLNLYGFRRVSKGPDVGSYYHPQFQRDRPDLVSEIKRTQQQGKAVAASTAPDTIRSSSPSSSLLSVHHSNTACATISSAEETHPPVLSSGPTSKGEIDEHDEPTPHLCYPVDNVLQILKNNTEKKVFHEKKPAVSKLLSNLLGLPRTPQAPPLPSSTASSSLSSSSQSLIASSSLEKIAFNSIMPINEEDDVIAFPNEPRQMMHSQSSQQQQQQSQQQYFTGDTMNLINEQVSSFNCDNLPHDLLAPEVDLREDLKSTERPLILPLGIHLTVPSDPRGNASCTIPSKDTCSDNVHRVLSYGSLASYPMQPKPLVENSKQSSPRTAAKNTIGRNGIGSLSNNLFRGRDQNVMIGVSPLGNSDIILASSDDVHNDSYVASDPPVTRLPTKMKLGSGNWSLADTDSSNLTWGGIQNK